MASYVNASSATRGVTSDETGLFIESFSESGNDPYDFLLDKDGGRVGFAYQYDESADYTVSGEYKDSSSGLLTETFGSTVTLANATASFFGITTGNSYLTGVTHSLSRGAFRSYNLTASRYGNIT